MKLLLIILLLITSIKGVAQECSPYHDIPEWETDGKKLGGIGYVSCFHARGVVAEVGYNNIFIGVLAMGQGHHGATYSFLQYEFTTHELRIYGGPVYRLNHDPSLLIGRLGADYKLYRNLYFTFSVLQVSTELNYLHLGLKLMI